MDEHKIPTPEGEGRSDGDVDSSGGTPPIGDLSCLKSVTFPDEMSSIRRLINSVSANKPLIVGIAFAVAVSVSAIVFGVKAMKDARKADESAEEIAMFRASLCGTKIFLGEKQNLSKCVPGQFMIGDQPDCEKLLYPDAVHESIGDRIREECGDDGFDGLSRPDGENILNLARWAYEEALTQACGDNPDANKCNFRKREINQRLRELMPNYAYDFQPKGTPPTSLEYMLQDVGMEDIDEVIALAFELGHEDLARAATVHKRKFLVEI